LVRLGICRVSFDCPVSLDPLSVGELYPPGDERDRLQSEIAALKNAKDMLPRCDKQGAHNHQSQINTLEALRRRVIATTRVYREKYEANETHGLWKLAVRKHAGEEVYEQCIAWMKQEKKRREIQKQEAA